MRLHCPCRWHACVQVSHWGRVYVTERYHVKHSGAAVVPPFSRWNLTYGAMMGATASPHIKSLTEFVHPQAQYVSFKDGIGNIMTTHVKPGNSGGLTAISLSPRYPLLGGWQTRFVLGYSLPLSAVVSTARGRNTITFSHIPVFEQVRHGCTRTTMCPCRPVPPFD
jgi:oligosaccharyltransferase complex subunit alpha (ribophorin I)